MVLRQSSGIEPFFISRMAKKPLARLKMCGRNAHFARMDLLEPEGI